MARREGLKLAVVGGGSVFTPELVELLAQRQRDGALDVAEIALYDIDAQRQATVAGLGRRIASNLGSDVVITEHNGVQHALEGASYVLLQLRAGGQQMRINDEHLGLRFHVPFAETITTCAVGAFIRTAQLYEELSLRIKEAGDPWVLNFTNPAGMLTQHLHALGIPRAVGLCNIPVLTATWMADELGLKPSEVYLNTRGLNHLTVCDHIYVGTEDVLPALLERGVVAEHSPFEQRTLDLFPYWINPYFQYVLHAERIKDELASAPTTRGETVLALEGELLASYGQVDLCHVPPSLEKRGGYRYSLAVVALIAALEGATPGVQYVNIANKGAVPGLSYEGVVEIPAYVERDSVRAMQCDRLPIPFDAIVGAYLRQQEQLSQASLTRSIGTLIKALTVNPLIPGVEVAEDMARALLAANMEYTKGWS